MHLTTPGLGGDHRVQRFDERLTGASRRGVADDLAGPRVERAGLRRGNRRRTGSAGFARALTFGVSRTGVTTIWLESEIEVAQNYGSACVGWRQHPTLPGSITTKSDLHGTRPSGVEVADVSPLGFWLVVDDWELCVSFVAFPQFEDATLRELARVERPSGHHPWWPAPAGVYCSVVDTT